MDSLDVAQEYVVVAASETSAIYFARIETVADDCCWFSELAAVDLKPDELVAVLAASSHYNMTDAVQKLADQRRTLVAIGRGCKRAEFITFE